MKKIPEIQIGTRKAGGGNPAFIIAELSANHAGKLENAKRTIETAAKCGADAVKLQTYTADTLTIDCDNEYFRIQNGTIWDGRNLYQLYQEAFTPWEWHEELKCCANDLGLDLFSSPFDKSAVDFLEALDMPAYKIASFEIVDTGLIAYVASKNKPIIISTGIAEVEDIELALKTCHDAGNDQIILLKCTSSYPAPIEEANLKNIADMQERFGVIAGLSDHTLGITVPIASVVLGAKMIEKHFIVDRNLGGPDASFSLEPDEFSAMVKGVREAERAMGDVTYDLTPKAKKGRIFSRSLFVVEDMEAGEVFSENNLRSIRPGHGLPPKYFPEILGKKAAFRIHRGTPLSWELIAN